MGATPDRQAGPSLEEELQLEDRGVAGDNTGLPTVLGSLRYVDGDVYARVPSGAVSLTGGAGGGLTETQHRSLRHLAHFLSGGGPGSGFGAGPYLKELTYVSNVFLSLEVWWETGAKLKKIVERSWERTIGPATNIKPTPIVTTVYKSDGVTKAAEAIDTVTYTGVFETSRTRTTTVFP